MHIALYALGSFAAQSLGGVADSPPCAAPTALDAALRRLIQRWRNRLRCAWRWHQCSMRVLLLALVARLALFTSRSLLADVAGGRSHCGAAEFRLVWRVRLFGVFACLARLPMLASLPCRLCCLAFRPVAVVAWSPTARVASLLCRPLRCGRWPRGPLCISHAACGRACFHSRCFGGLFWSACRSLRIGLLLSVPRGPIPSPPPRAAPTAQAGCCSASDSTAWAGGMTLVSVVRGACTCSARVLLLALVVRLGFAQPLPLISLMWRGGRGDAFCCQVPSLLWVNMVPGGLRPCRAVAGGHFLRSLSCAC